MRTDEWPDPARDRDRRQQRGRLTRECWTARYEALNYESAMDAAMAADDDARDALVAARGHRCQPETGYCWCWVELWEDTCLLPEGHEGPHVFTAKDDVILEVR